MSDMNTREKQTCLFSFFFFLTFLTLCCHEDLNFTQLLLLFLFSQGFFLFSGL